MSNKLNCCCLKLFALTFSVLLIIVSFPGSLAQKKQERSSASTTIFPGDVNPQFVSLVRLIATPEQFNDKEVLVKGFLSVEFENTALYLSKEHYDADLYQNAIWVNFQPRNKLQALDGRGNRIGVRELSEKYVIVKGVFKQNHKGHEGMYSGAIEEVRYVRQ